MTTALGDTRVHGQTHFLCCKCQQDVCQWLQRWRGRGGLAVIWVLLESR
jgi:hypothetical protein